MNFKDIKVSVLLRIGLGLILLFVVCIGVVFKLQSDSLWLQTETMYEHPLKVRRALGEMESDILRMHRGIKNLFLTNVQQEIFDSVNSVDYFKSNASRQLKIIGDRYLGPHTQVDILNQDFIKWTSICDNIIRLFREGKKDEAIAMASTSGIAGKHVDKLLNDIGNISKFAIDKGDDLYSNGIEHKRTLDLQLYLLVVGVLILSLLIAAVLLKVIRTPLKNLSAATDDFSAGNLNARCEYTGLNEFGLLANSFNKLADRIQVEMSVNEKEAALTNIMLKEDNLPQFCDELLKQLTLMTYSEIGAVYLRNDVDNCFSHFASIGVGADVRSSFSIKTREGEFGLAIATGKMQHITDIPEDSAFVFNTVSGSFKPREIVIIPILSGVTVSAVITLASLHCYKSIALRLIKEAVAMITVRLNNVMLFSTINDQKLKLESMNCELEEQKKELSLQANELTEHNFELSRQKQELSEANRLKSVFLSNMSHELRTPLNSVIALSSVLNRRLAGAISPEEHSYITVIERNGRHLLEMINDVLDLARIEAGKDEVELNMFSLKSLISEIITMLEPQAREKNIVLTSIIDENLPEICSDYRKCQHVLQNLTGNAVKFTEIGRVEITVKHSGNSCQIIVSDTGIGIAAEHLPYIFDEFRQADGSTSRKYGGTGLGLAIAKKYAQLLNGDIRVESVVNRGSIFTFTLPFIPVGATDDSNIKPYSPPSFSTVESLESELIRGDGKTILLVEDSEPAIIQMQDILGLYGYKCETARNGREAIEKISQIVPDAMILDLMMPEVDGFEVLRQLKTMINTKLLPVLILTAKHLTWDDISFIKECNVRQLIQKGDVNKNELLVAVQKMVNTTAISKSINNRVDARKTVKKNVKPRENPILLVVEDNPDNMLTFRALLENKYKLIEATDGRAGVAAAATYQPDLIIMDIALPIMNGFEAFDEIRGNESLSHIPIVAVTASVMKGNREEIVSYGFDAYVSKPIDNEMFIKNIESVLYGNG